MQFSLDHKRRSHKLNQCFASDSVDLIFTRSYRSTPQISTPTTTVSLVKTSLKTAISLQVFHLHFFLCMHTVTSDKSQKTCLMGMKSARSKVISRSPGGANAVQPGSLEMLQMAEQLKSGHGV